MDDTFEEAANVIENPEEYVGEVVTAPGTVDEVITPYLFSIGAADAVWDPLLVLHDGSTEVTEGMDVAAIGEVMASLETEEAAAFVGQDVDEAVIGTYSGDVYVQASQVEPVDPAP